MPGKAKLIPRISGAPIKFLVIPFDEYLINEHLDSIPEKYRGLIPPERQQSRRKDSRRGHPFYHRPDVLNVKDCVVLLGLWCFDAASSEFGDYGFWKDTVYAENDLKQLIVFLSLQVEMLRTCRRKRELRPFITPLFDAVFLEDIGPWDQYWPRIRDEVVDLFNEILQYAKKADEDGYVFLFMGL